MPSFYDMTILNGTTSRPQLYVRVSHARASLITRPLDDIRTASPMFLLLSLQNSWPSQQPASTIQPP